MAILVLCVNYRSDDETTQLVENIFALAGADEIAVVVTDNSSAGPESPLQARLSQWPRVWVVAAPDNPGYFPGADRGLKHYLRLHDWPDWIVICNTDVEFPERDLFVRLRGYHDREPPAIVAPSVVRVTTGADHNPFARSRPGLLRRAILYSLFTFRYVAYMWFRVASWREQMPSQSHKEVLNEPEAIFAPHGSFLILHRKYFDYGGDLLVGTGLYYEEYYVGEVARILGLQVIYDPRLCVLHRPHTSTSGLNRLQMFKAMKRANRRIMNVFRREFEVEFRRNLAMKRAGKARDKCE